MKDWDKDMEILDSFLDVVEDEMEWARNNVENFNEDDMRDDAAEIYARMPEDDE